MGKSEWVPAKPLPHLVQDGKSVLWWISGKCHVTPGIPGICPKTFWYVELKHTSSLCSHLCFMLLIPVIARRGNYSLHLIYNHLKPSQKIGESSSHPHTHLLPRSCDSWVYSSTPSLQIKQPWQGILAQKFNVTLYSVKELHGPIPLGLVNQPGFKIAPWFASPISESRSKCQVLPAAHLQEECYWGSHENKNWIT